MLNLCKLFCLAALTLVSASLGYGATINVPCNYASITNAVLTTAKAGDTVLIGSGDCTISNTITIQRGFSFTIAGSGTNQTTLRSCAGERAVIKVIIPASTNVFTIRDLNCVGTVANDDAFLSFCAVGSTNPGTFHVYNIKMTNVLFRGISGGMCNSIGLIDHCWMFSPSNSNPQFLNFQGAGYGSWTNTANPLGTTNAVYVEDCYFYNTPGNFGNGFWDAYDGAQLVIRHCFFDGYSAAGMHGYDSQPTSARTWEIYNNIFTNTDRSSGIIDIRGGTGMIFSNTCYYQGVSPGQFVTLVYYRACLSNWPAIGSVTGWLNYGQAGAGYVVNFAGVQEKYGPVLNGNPTNGQTLGLGLTRYTFVSALTNAAFGMVNPNGFGGGAVLIGSTVAGTITNLYRAVNVVPGYYGICYTNWAGYNLPYRPGHDYIAIGTTATELILTNALDSNADQYGYPANQQEGVMVSYPLTGTNFVNHQIVFPIYEWANTLNGVLKSFNLVTACNGSQWPGLKSGRDYFDNVQPSPTIYTPLVYPHPLRALEGGLPTLPTYSLTVVNGTGSGTYTSNSIVSISANTLPQLGTFKNWGGLGIANTNSAITTVTMSVSNLTVNANYIPSPPTQLAPTNGQ